MVDWNGLFNKKGAKFAVKLNTKRTMLVGLAFLSICIFWQMYDSVMTLILTDTFHLNETIAGAVMAADNVLALFLLPLLGGSVGALLGMRVFHHKTKHWYFVWGVPAILLAQLALAVWLLTR